MLQFLKQKRGQSTLEYAVLIVVIIGALLTVQGYVKNGVQGRLKDATDNIGDQFSPGNTNSYSLTNKSSYTVQTFNAGTSGSNLNYETTNTTGNSVILNGQYSYWGS